MVVAADACVDRAESTGCQGREGVAYRIKPSHAGQSQYNGFDHRQSDVYHPQNASCFSNMRMHSFRFRPRCLNSEKFLPANSEGRKYGDEEDHYPETS